MHPVQDAVTSVITASTAKCRASHRLMHREIISYPALAWALLKPQTSQNRAAASVIRFQPAFLIVRF